MAYRAGTFRVIVVADNAADSIGLRENVCGRRQCAGVSFIQFRDLVSGPCGTARFDLLQARKIVFVPSGMIHQLHRHCSQTMDVRDILRLYQLECSMYFQLVHQYNLATDAE